MKPRDYSILPYARIVIPDEDGGFYAEVLEFPGCFAEGETVEEAFSNLDKAATSWIEVARANGQDIPEPSSSFGFGGKVALRLPRSLHKRAVRLAQRDRTSLNQFLVAAIAGRVGSEEVYSRIVDRLESRLVATAANLTEIIADYLDDHIHGQVKVYDQKLLPDRTADTTKVATI